MNINFPPEFIAAVGAAASAFCAYRGSVSAAKKAGDIQLKATAQAAFITARLDAFLAYESAFGTWAAEKSRQSCADLYCAENALRLVASDETIAAVGKLTKYVRLFESGSSESVPFDKIADAHAAALLAMRRDVHSYPIPEPESRKAHGLVQGLKWHKYHEKECR